MKTNQIFRNITSLLLIAVTAAACTTEGKTIVEETTKKTVDVETVAVKKHTSVYTLDLPGQVEPFEQVELYPKVTGFVKKMYVDRGSYVKKGQLLARLEAPEITQQYVAASAKQREVAQSLRYSFQAYNRLQQAAKSTGAVAAIELEQAYSTLMSDSATYQVLKAEMAAAEQLAAYLAIRAPFSGVISERTVSQGALVGANEKPLFTLAEQDRLRLTIAIPAKHARSLSESAEIRYQLSSYPNETFTAQLSRSSKVLDQKLRSLIVEFDISNKNKMLRGGEYVQAQVDFQPAQASLWVPTSSIVHTSTGTFVLKVGNNTVERIAVKEGIRKDDMTEVFGDLNENDQVVKKGSEELREGMVITMKNINVNQ